MSLMSLEKLTSANPALTNSNIRIDKVTQQAISTIITNMGFNGQNNATLSKIGKVISKVYREKHGTAPEKTQKYVNGSVRTVNAYKKSDMTMIQEIITDTL